MSLTAIPLPHRAALRISGGDARHFLQGIITGNIERVTPARAMLSALLSPQGKFQADFFVAQHGDALLFDTETATLEALVKRLTLYRLRADVHIERLEAYRVTALQGENAHAACGLEATPGAAGNLDGGVIFTDPRFAALGVRLLAPAEVTATYLARLGATPAPLEAYEALRLKHAIPEGSRDAEIDRTILLENGYDVFGGVDFDKGCYVGQEVTARSRHRGTLRKGLCKVTGEAPLSSGAALRAGEKTIGQMRSTQKNIGLALIRLDEWEAAKNAGESVYCGEMRVTVEPPWWRA